MAVSHITGLLSELPTRLLFSDQLQAVGRLMLSEIRARHFPPGFARRITEALREPGKLLGRPVMQGEPLDARDLRGWGLPVLLTAAAASGAQSSSLARLPPSFWRRARAAAAASEFLGAALDIIDDVQDGDSAFVQRLGMPLALNTGIALLELVPIALNRARSTEWSDAQMHAALETLHASILTSLGGQYLDLRFEQMSAVNETQVMEMTEKKSGTLLALICRLGAMAGATYRQERPFSYFETVSLFGWHLGVWFQLLNDLHDAEEAQTQAAKSDRQRQKKTLPLVLEQRGMIEGTDRGKQDRSLDAQTALSYTYAVAETFRLRAQNALQALEEQFGPHPLLWPLTLPTWEGS
ncbi:MAG TPA: polyprenyl synthetase family protein [Ktedonobacterales bacterium]|jgi:geranylgeranyl pyrophosphate synthase